MSQLPSRFLKLPMSTASPAGWRVPGGAQRSLFTAFSLVGRRAALLLSRVEVGAAPFFALVFTPFLRVVFCFAPRGSSAAPLPSTVPLPSLPLPTFPTEPSLPTERFLPLRRVPFATSASAGGGALGRYIV